MNFEAIYIILITGGTGFIGSHLVERIVKNNDVRIIDNLSTSTKANIDGLNVDFIEKDLNNLDSSDVKDVEEVYHMAANPEVKLSADDPRNMFENNIRATFNLLEQCRQNDIKKIIFSSTSTVYGEANTPTPETEVCNAISNYGASKIACESLITAYSNTYGINYVILRYANIFGPRSNKGVIHDFFFKLKKDSKNLEILGDGEQNKSYLYIDDCIDATLEASKKNNDIFNIGSDSQMKVKDIASLVVNKMNLNNVKFNFTGKSWKGDVHDMLLDITKIKNIGWKPKVSIEKGIELYINSL